MMRRLAHLVSYHPLWVLGFWLAVIALSLPLAARVGEVLNAQPDTPPGSVARHVKTILSQEFDGEDDETVVLVASSQTHRVGEPAFDAPFEQARARIAALDGVTSVQDYRERTDLKLVSDDGSYTIAIIGIAGDLLAAKHTTERIREVVDTIPELHFSLSGGPATVAELEAISERDARRAELFGLPLSLVVLVVAFGALVASALPLVIALTSITVSFAALFLLGQVIDFAVFTQSIVTMLGLATGIDYALLLVNRFREELRHTFDPRAAAERTALTAGRAVAFSGFTVMIALLALLIPPLTFIRSIGIGTILVLAVSVTVSLTALPAALALLGHRVNWLRVTRREPGMRSRSFWRERAEMIMKRPWLWAVGGALVLVLLSVPALSMRVADSGTQGLSERTDARQILEALHGLGLDGLLRSFDVLVDFNGNGFFDPGNVRKVSRLTRELEANDQIMTVFSPVSAGTIPRLLLYQYYATRETALASEVAGLARSTISTDGRFALVRVFPTKALGPDASQQLVDEIRAAAAGLGIDSLVGGSYVAEHEWVRSLYRSFPLAIGLVYIATLVLLGLAFRSLLIPLKSIVLNTLTVGAAYGVITLVFQDGIFVQLFGLGSGLGFVDSSTPLFIFAIVFGLSMDYEVFLVARIFEAHQRGLSDRDAVVSALSTTGGVITSAAAVMILVFSLFLFSEVVLMKTLGLGLTVAIILDATLVRVALVPAVMTLAGAWNWWLPRPVQRFADRLDLRHD